MLDNTLTRFASTLLFGAPPKVCTTGRIHNHIYVEDVNGKLYHVCGCGDRLKAAIDY